jgi:hypothetical protein
VDSRFSTQFDGMGGDPRTGQPDFTDLGAYRSGVTGARVSISGMEPELVDWDRPELPFAGVDDIVNRMVDNGLELTYVLMFWDKEQYPGGTGAPCYRFTTEEETARYLEWVRAVVRHFGDRVANYEIWNEPDIADYCPKSIRLSDYIALIRETVPVIRDASPEAEIVVGAVSNTYYERDYLLDLAASDVMPLVDTLSWHPMYDTSPEIGFYTEYYYAYPEFVREIKNRAESAGFTGSYRADELGWNTPDDVGSDAEFTYTPIRANKYFARAAITHLGLDVDVGLGNAYFIAGNLATLMDQAVPTDVPLEVDSSGEAVVHYAFALPGGDLIVALWTDGIATEIISTTEATLSFPGLTATEVVGVDPLASMRQRVMADEAGGALTLRGLLVRDYPTFLRLVGPQHS